MACKSKYDDNDGYSDDQNSYHSVYHPYTSDIKAVAHLIDQQRQKEPPCHGSNDHEQITYDLRQRVIRNNECQLAEHGHKQKYYQRI